MASELNEELQTIDGIGEAKANEILEIVGNPENAKAVLKEGLGYYESGNPQYAQKFVQQAIEELE